MSAKGDVKRIYNVITDNENGESALVMAHNIVVNNSTHLFNTVRRNRQTSTNGDSRIETFVLSQQITKKAVLVFDLVLFMYLVGCYSLTRALYTVTLITVPRPHRSKPPPFTVPPK